MNQPSEWSLIKVAMQFRGLAAKLLLISAVLSKAQATSRFGVRFSRGGTPGTAILLFATGVTLYLIPVHCFWARI